ncbi:nucleotidyltransferase family protein, partial [candidate division WOR-3 bacterium]|nr:nucleotidyltransferase family protein [candidate division WOR-3 bacterium]
MTSTVETLFRLLSNKEPGAQNAEPRPTNQEPETRNQGLLGVDWNAVLNTAARNSLEPLLFKRLKESGTRAYVRPDAWNQLRLAYFESARKNLHLYRELRPVLRLLRDSDIPVIVLKGAFLAEAVYGDV